MAFLGDGAAGEDPAEEEVEAARRGAMASEVGWRTGARARKASVRIDSVRHRDQRMDLLSASAMAMVLDADWKRATFCRASGFQN